MLRKKRFWFIAAFLFLSLFLVACNGDDDDGAEDDNGAAADVVEEDDDDDDEPEVVEEDDDDGDVAEAGAADEFRIAIAGNIGSRDPHGSNDMPSAQVNTHVFGRLVEQDINLDIQPAIAESWEQIDDRVWEFNLREGIAFHNGDPLTAHDVAFTMERAADAGHIAPILGMIDPDTVEVIDDYTIRIGTEEPFAPFLAHLAHPAASILSEAAVGDTSPEDTTPEQLVGSGPYQIYEFVEDTRIILERWEDYHGPSHNIRIIYMPIIVDPPARLAALETGAVDAMLSPAPADISRVLDDPNIYTIEEQSLAIEYMGMDLNHEYLSIPEVRQAINYALNTEVIVDVSTEGTATLLTNFIPSNVFGYDPNIEGYPYDLERAQELMAEAGVDGFDIELITNQGNVIRLAAAEIIQNQLAEININVSIQQLEWGAYLEALDTTDFDVFMAGWVSVTGDADYGLYPLFHSAYHPESNRVGLASPELDAILEAARSTTVESERLELYTEAQEYLHTAAPWVRLGNANLYVPTALNVNGLVVMPHQSHWFADVYFD